MTPTSWTLKALMENNKKMPVEKQFLNILHEDQTFYKNLFLGYKNKFEKLQKMILNNDFLTKAQKEKGLDLFCKTQKINNICKKFYNKLKYRITPFADITTDLVGNSFDDIKDNNIIILIQDNRKYKFRVSDLINIITMKLKYSAGLTPDPRIPKNPYTNKSFKKYNLYNIYFHIRFNTSFIISNIISSAFISGFDINKFEELIYPQLKDFAIKNYIENASTNAIYREILSMMARNKRLFQNRTFNLDPPREFKLLALQKMKNVYSYYIIYISSCNTITKRKAHRTFIKNAEEFIKNNPKFGRKIVRIIRSRYCPSSIEDIEDDEDTEEEEDDEDIEDIEDIEDDEDIEAIENLMHFMETAQEDVEDIEEVEDVIHLMRDAVAVVVGDAENVEEIESVIMADYAEDVEDVEDVEDIEDVEDEDVEDEDVEDVEDVDYDHRTQGTGRRVRRRGE
jgi:hypothetical protein